MSEWKLVGKLDKRRDFAGNPTESLHKRIRTLAPEINRVEDVGVTSITMEYLKQKVDKAIRKKYPYISDRKADASVGMTMLCSSPVYLSGPEYKDFHIYVRIS
jgi:hypothetical protein